MQSLQVLQVFISCWGLFGNIKLAAHGITSDYAKITSLLLTNMERKLSNVQ